MKLSKKEAQELFREDALEIQGLSLKLHEYGTWDDYGKFDNLWGQIYKDEITGRFYCLNGLSRYGSYHEGYEYDCSLFEVHEQPITIMEWCSVPQGF